MVENVVISLNPMLSMYLGDVSDILISKPIASAIGFGISEIDLVLLYEKIAFLKVFISSFVKFRLYVANILYFVNRLNLLFVL